MGTSTGKQPRIVVVLKLDEYKTPLLITRARSIVKRMTGNSWFPKPSPSLKVVSAAIDDLDRAQTRTLTRALDSVTARDQKRRALEMRLQQLAGYVQMIATANPEHAAAIVASAGMYLKRWRGSGSRIFEAYQENSGEVKVLVPRAGNRASYEFQYSLNGGVTWLPFQQPSTTKASATLPNMKPGSTVHLRYRATVKGVTGNWSQTIWIIVT